MPSRDHRAIARDWLARFQHRLEAYDPLLQAEIIDTVHTKASRAAMDPAGAIVWRINDEPGKPSDLTLCIKRVLSRMRLYDHKTPPPDDPDVFREQMRGCAAKIGVQSPWER